MTTQLAQLQTVQKGRILEGLPGQLRLGSRGRGNERERERDKGKGTHILTRWYCKWWQDKTVFITAVLTSF